MTGARPACRLATAICLVGLGAGCWSDQQSSEPDAGNDAAQVVDSGQVDMDSAADLAADAGPPACGTDRDCDEAEACVGGRCVSELRVWPNSVSRANSDPWLAENHAQLLQLRPRILALNFVNHKTNAQMASDLQRIIDALTEASRYHGYDDPDAVPALRMELAYAIDLRDERPAPAWPHNNSSLYPREDPQQGYWSFDYEQLFSREFADLYRIADPDDPQRMLDLCQAIDAGLVHEVWVYGDADLPDAGAAEILELKPHYTAQRRRRDDAPMNRCAGNGCFDEEDTIPAHCRRTVRVGWVNNNRGPGCFIESLSHGFESIGRNAELLPYLQRHFVDFAGFNLDSRYGLLFDSWYSCRYGEPCLSYPTPTSVSYTIGSTSGAVSDYDPVCGNVHFAPNARQHYDLTSDLVVHTTCEGYRLGGGPGGADVAAPFSPARLSQYAALAQDCMGPFLVYWRQNMPGPGSAAVDLDDHQMLSWWPFIYY